MSAILWFAVGSGLVALAYGLYATRSVLAASAGTERMQEIAGAVQEGAQAPTSTANTARSPGSAWCIFAVIWGLFGYLKVAGGYLIGAVLSGADRLHRHERLGAGQRAHGRGGQDRQGPQAEGLERRLPGGGR